MPIGERPGLAERLVVAASDSVLYDHSMLALQSGDLWLVDGAAVVPAADNGAAKQPARASKALGLSAKVQVAIAQAKTAMLPFAADAWAAQMKESRLTAPISRLAALSAECEASCATTLRESIAEWQAIASRAKAFVRMYIQYRRKFVHARLLELAPTLKEFCDLWERLMEVPAAPSLRALNLHGCFAATCDGATVDVIPGALQLVVAGAKDLFPHRLGSADEEPIHLEPWLRQGLARAFKACLSEVTVEDSESCAPRVHQAVTEVDALLVPAGCVLGSSLRGARAGWDGPCSPRGWRWLGPFWNMHCLCVISAETRVAPAARATSANTLVHDMSAALQHSTINFAWISDVSPSSTGFSGGCAVASRVRFISWDTLGTLSDVTRLSQALDCKLHHIGCFRGSQDR